MASKSNYAVADGQRLWRNGTKLTAGDPVKPTELDLEVTPHLYKQVDASPTPPDPTASVEEEEPRVGNPPEGIPGETTNKHLTRKPKDELKNIARTMEIEFGPDTTRGELIASIQSAFNE